MSENKLNDNELEFDDEIDFEGLEDFESETENERDCSETESAEEYEEGFNDNVKSEVEFYSSEYEKATEELLTDDYDEAAEDCAEAEELYSEGASESACPQERKADNVAVNRFCIINTAISAVTLCAVAAGITLGYNYISSVEKDLEIKSAEIEALEKKNNALEEDYLEAIKLFGEDNEKEIDTSEADIENGKILFYDTSVGYSWMPVLTGISQNDYIKENFVLDSRGRLSYVENGEEASYFGIDVSSYQGNIDWQLVKEDNVEFAFLRIGYRGYGAEGKLCTDEKFSENYSAAHDAGIDLGVYFFSQAASVDEAVEEANYVLSLLEGRTLEYPIVFDWETVQTGDPEDIPRTEDVMPGTLTLSAIAFCETIRDAGYDAMIYTNKKLATIKYDLRQLQDYPVWLAYYDTELDYCYDFDIWQYGTGQVDGIEGEVDINIAIIK